ncbi:MAG: hypothetical protein IT364_04990 [Candidatus Hydrogenedentes bacterium]|nr:hypothetical protein [Candidatus Hydrogenedentota bacterium]
MKNLGHHRLLVFAAIGMASLLFADRLVLSPLWSLWSERQTRIADLQTAVEQDQALCEREDGIRKRWQSMLEGSLPASESEAESLVLRSVNEWAGMHGVQVTTVKPRWSVEEKESALLECRATALGSLRALSGFLHALETSPLALRVEEVALVPRDDRGSLLSLELRFTGLVLAKPEEGAGS